MLVRNVLGLPPARKPTSSSSSSSDVVTFGVSQSSSTNPLGTDEPSNKKVPILSVKAAAEFEKSQAKLNLLRKRKQVADDDFFFRK